MDREQIRTEIVAHASATAAEIDELSRYNANTFDFTSLRDGIDLPLADEPFLASWDAYAAEARQRGVFQALWDRLPQLRFPIREGISQHDDYRAATRWGEAVELLTAATGLELNRPEALELVLCPTVAGRIPVLIVHGHDDFVSLVRALTSRNEPAAVPDAQGALMVAGYNNWDRIRALRRRWEERAPDQRQTDSWDAEFKRILPQRDLYQDRFIVVDDGFYSAVPPGEIGVEAERWRELSIVIRREHECTHYLTRRVLGSMRNNALDELLADYAGITAACGRFRSEWFLRFVGLESYPRYRAGARLDIYRGEPPLSPGAFRVLHRLLKAAAENLEALDGSAPGDLRARSLRLLSIATLRLEELAAPQAGERIERAARDLGRRIRWREAA